MGLFDLFKRKSTKGDSFHSPTHVEISGDDIPSVNVNDDCSVRVEKLKIVSDSPTRPKYRIPDSSLLSGNSNVYTSDADAIKGIAIQIESILQSYGVNLEITDIISGPRVIRYEAILQAGTKITKVTSLIDTLKCDLRVNNLDIIAPIPGKSAIGFDIERLRANIVTLKDSIDDVTYKNCPRDLLFGRDAASNEIVGLNFDQIPNLIVAGMSGTGKTSFVHANVIKSLVEKGKDEIKFLFIDSKIDQYTVFNGIPQLLSDIIKDPREVAAKLSWCKAEAEERLQKISTYGLKNLDSYNQYVTNATGLNSNDSKMPHIIVVLDDWYELQLSASDASIEESIYSIARLSAIVGIHIWLITSQTGIRVLSEQLKSVILDRLSFALSNASQAKNINVLGAEKLSSNGDALLSLKGKKYPIHTQMVYVNPEDSYLVSLFCRRQNFSVEKGKASPTITNKPQVFCGVTSDNEIDEYFPEAGRVVILDRKASIGYLQRMLKIGFNRASGIMDSLEKYGVVGEARGTEPRQILMNINEFENLLKTMQ